MVDASGVLSAFAVGLPTLASLALRHRLTGSPLA